MLKFDDSDRIFIGNNFSLLPKFDLQFKFLLLQHAVDLFVPKQMLYDIKRKLREQTSLVYLSYDKILSYLNQEQKQKFKSVYSDNYSIYVLYCDPILDMDKFSWRYKKSIKDFFLRNVYCPASRFYSNDISIIVLNSRVISLDDNGNQLQLQLDHQLNHIFDKLSDRVYPDLNQKIRQECLRYFKQFKILSYDIQSDDFSIHMFNSSEFFQMLSNLCNVISLYFNQTNKIKIYQKLMNMLTHDYFLSEQFKKLEQPVQGALVFAFICKKYSPDRWNRTIKAVKAQLDLTGFANSLKIILNNLAKNVSNFLH